MNTNILKKCVEELRKDKPSIEYVLGMLESVIELSSNTIISNVREIKKDVSQATPEFDENEGSGILAAYKSGPIAKLE